MGDSVWGTIYVKYLGNLFGNRSLRLCTISSQAPEVQITSMHLPIVSVAIVKNEKSFFTCHEMKRVIREE